MSSRQERRASARAAPKRDTTASACAQARAFLASATPKTETTLRFTLCGVCSQDFSGEGVKLLLAVGAPTSGCDGLYPATRPRREGQCSQVVAGASQVDASQVDCWF